MSTDTPTPASVSDRYAAVQRSDEFVGLRKALRGFVFPMTVAFFLWYALYVILSAYARGFMGTKLVGNANVAFAFGLLQFVSTFLIAWFYSRYAESKLDPVADRIRAEMEDHVGAGGVATNQPTTAAATATEGAATSPGWRTEKAQS